MNITSPKSVILEPDKYDPEVVRNLETLAFLIQDTDANLITFALYRDLRNRKLASDTLRQRLNLRVAEFSLTPQKKNPFLFFSAVPFTERGCIFLYGLEEALPEIAGYLNLQREKFLALPHALVFWVTEYGLQQVANLSPDFWAWRSGVFDLRTPKEISPPALVEQLLADDSVFRSRQDLEKKISLYQELLQDYQKQQPPDGRLLAGLHRKLAEAYNILGRYNDGIRHARRALQLANEFLDRDHPDIAASLDILAGLYQILGNYIKAEPLHLEALKKREKAFGPDHPDVAESLNNLAALYWKQGRYAEAELLLSRALKIGEKALGPDHPDVATSLNNLATLYYSQGRLDEAKPLLQRALEIREKALGPDHLSVAVILNNIGTLSQPQSNYTEAANLLQRALNIREKALGHDHPSVAASLNNLAVIYQYQGKFAEAEPLFQRSLQIREKALGLNHPDVATSLENIASLLLRTGREREVAPLEERARAIREKHKQGKPVEADSQE